MVNYADYDQITLGKAPFLDEIKLKNIVRALLTTFDDKKIATQDTVASCDRLISEINEALD